MALLVAMVQRDDVAALDVRRLRRAGLRTAAAPTQRPPTAPTVINTIAGWRASAHSSSCAAAFTPHCAHQLVSISEDRTFKVWDLAKRGLFYQSAVLSAHPLLR